MNSQKLTKKPSIEFYNLVNQSVAILSFENNQDNNQDSLWIKMGNELEMEQFPQNQISKIKQLVDVASLELQQQQSEEQQNQNKYHNSSKI